VLPVRAASISDGALRVTLALLRGDWRILNLELRRYGNRYKTRRDDADGVYGAQMFALNATLATCTQWRPR